MEEYWRTLFESSVLGIAIRVRGINAFFSLDGQESKERNPLHWWEKSLMYRTTSIAGDEPVCLATLLRFSESKIRTILDIPKADVAGRMQRFWEAHANPPPHIIINGSLRLEHPGFRWAPRTFLDTRSRQEEMWKSPPETKLTQSGLWLTASGFLLEVPPMPSFQEAQAASRIGFDTYFLFRDQQGDWFLVRVVVYVEGNRTWWSADSSMSIALVLMDEPGETRRDVSGMPEPSMLNGLAALALVCNDEYDDQIRQKTVPEAASRSKIRSFLFSRTRPSISTLPGSITSSPLSTFASQPSNGMQFHKICSAR